MPKFIDLTGQRFTRLLVLKRTNTPSKRAQWECLCDCGNLSYAFTSDLKNDKHKSCGCLQREAVTTHGVMRKPRAEIGARFGRLVLQRLLHGAQPLRWECLCDCGTATTVAQSNLLNGNVKSCGCLRRDMGRMKHHDLTGKTFGRLTVIRSGVHIKGVAAWLCHCSCGNETTVRTYCLTSGRTTSCGCWKRESVSRRSLHDVTGQTFAMLTVICRGPDHGHHVQWVCRCVCGTLRIVDAYHLTSGHTTSCGSCARKDHGATGTPDILLKRTYYSWRSMRDRCCNPNNLAYAYYGGRGITACERWNSFAAFLEDMGPKPSLEHSLDRMDSNGHYEPSNCRWATKQEQSMNRRPAATRGQPRRAKHTGRFTAGRP